MKLIRLINVFVFESSKYGQIITSKLQVTVLESRNFRFNHIVLSYLRKQTRRNLTAHNSLVFDKQVLQAKSPFFNVNATLLLAKLLGAFLIFIVML